MSINEAKSMSTNPEENLLSLESLFAFIWSKKILIICFSLLFGVVAALLSLQKPNLYTAEVVLIPSQDNMDNASKLSGLGGLASIAGVDVSNRINKLDLALAILGSREFISSFLYKEERLQELFAVKAWDSSTNVITFDDAVYDVNTGEWTREVSLPFKAKPSKQEAFKAFKKIFKLERDSDNGLIILSLTHQSPEVAKEWLDSLVAEINDKMRKKDIAESEKAIKFLNSSLESTNINEIRESMYHMIQEHTKTLVLANVKDEYVFNTVDPAISPEEKSGPKRTIIAIASTLLGGGVGCMLAIFFFFRRNKNNL